jgi:hypothetical protein
MHGGADSGARRWQRRYPGNGPSTLLAAEARTLYITDIPAPIEQARAAEAERARLVAEKAAAVAAVEAEAQAAEAAKRQQLEARRAALALELQQVQAELGSGSCTPQPDAEECLVCTDAPKDHIVLPCVHICVCEVCAQLLRDRCPVCCGPIERITQVFT